MAEVGQQVVDGQRDSSRVRIFETPLRQKTIHQFTSSVGDRHREARVSTQAQVIVGAAG